MREVRIDRWNDRATVIHEPAAVGIDAMLGVVTAAGFEASVASSGETGSAETGTADRAR